jgi:REP element-mobilizing transposase RayT
MEFKRKTHRLEAHEYLGQRWYFVTMCCENRKQIFRDGSKAQWVVEFLSAEAQLHQFVVDAYCVMPDHLHFLAFGKAAASNLLAFAKSFKQKTAYVYHQKTGARLWQKNYYDHVLRANEESRGVAAYIWLNPVRKRLCKSFEEYQYSGSFTRPWKSSTHAPAWTPPWRKRQMPA